jgi:hypothetical protein
LLQIVGAFPLAILQYYILKWTGRTPTQETYLERQVAEYENLMATRNETTGNIVKYKKNNVKNNCIKYQIFENNVYF